jgi:hypothetical protein
MRRSRWASSRPSGVLPGLVAVNWKGPPETLQTHSVRMNLRPGNCQVLSVPSPQLRVLRLLADDGVLHDGVAEVVHYRCDSQDATQPLVQTFLGRSLRGLPVGLIRRREYSCRRRAATASPATTLRLVKGVGTDCAMVVISLAGATERGKSELDDCMGTSFVTAVRPCRASVRDLMQRSVRGSRKSIDGYDQWEASPRYPL